LRRLTVAATSGLLVVGSLAATSGQSSAASPSVSHRNVHVCSAPTDSAASCLAIRHDVVRDGHVVPHATSPSASSYKPADIQAAYNLPGSGAAGTGSTVAIVDAYDDPTAAADLNTYRSSFGLPACGSGCFTKVNQTGKTTPLPRKNGGWAQEISLDLDMVSAACPSCKILLVEANSASFADLNTAVATAQRLGAVAISNSYGGSDASDAHYKAYANAATAGIAVTASTGDSGYQVQSPASFPGVVSVGGTHLVRDKTARGWTDTAWSGAGSGCSTNNAKPTYQTSVTQCAGKANADVSAVADPNTGVAVYDSTAYQGLSGWLTFGGTSASSPIIAAAFGAAGWTGKGGSAGAQIWSHAGSLYDAVGGSNGSCSPALWCNAVAGWDGPTGLGTPNGTSAF
jgi:subtilase family serine protease